MEGYLLHPSTRRIEIVNTSSQAYTLLKFAGHLTGYLFVPQNKQIMCLCASYQFNAYPVIISIDDTETSVSLLHLSTRKADTQLFMILDDNVELLSPISLPTLEQLELTLHFRETLAAPILPVSTCYSCAVLKRLNHIWLNSYVPYLKAKSNVY